MADGKPPNGRRRFRTGGLPRAISVSIKKSRPNALEVRADDSTIEEFVRPRIWADCKGGGVNAQRPCPFVSCKHHLYLDVSAETGTLKLNYPELEPWELERSCSLDVAEEGPHTLEEVGEIMRLTRERSRQIEVKGLVRLRLLSPESEGSHDYNPPDAEEVRRRLAAKPGRKRGPRVRS